MRHAPQDAPRSPPVPFARDRSRCLARAVAGGWVLIAAAGVWWMGAVAVVAEPVRIIFDTDMTGDVDDVLALAMCHVLADRGGCDLLGVTISKHHPQTASFVDAVNTFYGRSDLPIGVTRDPTAQHRESRYLDLAAAAAYPHDLRSNDEAREAVDLVRELLAGAPERSVTIVSVGIASNLANLLTSPPDVHADLDGVALVRAKVRGLSIMAGAFQTIDGDTRYREANVVNGIPAMQQVADRWPDDVPVVWSGFEIGVALPFPRRSVAEDFSVPTPHIVREAYLRHSGPEHDRPCWDQSSVLHAVFPDRGYFGLSPPGRVRVADDGATDFVPRRAKADRGGRDRFLTMSPVQQSRALEAIVQLTVQPPRR